MIQGIINGLLNMLLVIVNIVMIPINALLENLFPSIASLIGNFTAVCNNYIAVFGQYIGSLIPPHVKMVLVMWLTFLIGFYGTIWAFHLIANAWHLIQKLKFW